MRREQLADEPPLWESAICARSGRGLLFLAVCGLGVSAFVTQLTLMRELVSVFAGNELVFGIVLGSWFLLTGVGSSLGALAPRLRRPVHVLVAAQIVIAILPVADVFLVRVLRNVVFLHGAAVGLSETVASCLVLLAPYCLIAGFLLTLATRIIGSKQGPASIGQVYFLDNVGDIAGGFLFTFVLVWLFDHFQILYFPAFLNLGLAALVAWRFGFRGWLAAGIAVGAALAVLVSCYDLDDISIRREYAGQEVVFRGSSPYGSLVVTREAGQYNFIHNGVPLFSTDNVEEVEEAVHYAMAQRPEARRVLLIGGGVTGTAKEILKYGVGEVDYVELDPLILQIGWLGHSEGSERCPRGEFLGHRSALPQPPARQFVGRSLDDPRIHVVVTDGRRFVRQPGASYDVVIVDVPDPSTSQLNRFYTREFFGEVRRRLAPDGVLAVHVGEYENYLSPELAKLIDVTHQTLRQEFRNVLILPTGRILFLASDGALTTDVASRIEAKGIATRLVKRAYLIDTLRPMRLAAVRRAITDRAPINTDFNPILYYYHLRYWMSQFQVRLGLLVTGLFVLLAVSLWRIRPVALGILTGGFAASALEVVLLLVTQILYGSVYYQVGLIVTMFMLGLGIGSLAMNRILPRRGRRDLAMLAFAMAAYAACLPLVLKGLSCGGAGPVASVLAQATIPGLTLVLAMLVGMEFPLAGTLDSPDHGLASTAARLYRADYLGAALGALVVSTLLLPVLGVVAVCLLAAGLNILSGVVILLTSGRAG